MLELSNGLDPHSGLGLCLLVFGALFTSGVVLIFLNLDEDSAEDRQRKELIAKNSEQKILRLYPKKDNNNN